MIYCRISGTSLLAVELKKKLLENGIMPGKRGLSGLTPRTTIIPPALAGPEVQRRILCVDDAPMNRKLLMRIMKVKGNIPYYTAILYYYTILYYTILLDYYTIIILYYYTIILLYYYTIILLYYYTIILLYYYTHVPLTLYTYIYTTIPLYNIPLYSYTTIL
jgi:hypothetical protein